MASHSSDENTFADSTTASTPVQFDELDKASLKRETHDASLSSEPEKALTEKEEPNGSPRSIHGIKWTLACISLYLGAFVYGLDTTITADVQVPIIARFGEVGKLTWMGTGYPLGSVAAILPLGALYGKLDMKWVYIISFIIFQVGSAVCGGAPTMNALIIGRVITGLGGSGVYMGALNFFSVCTTENERGSYISGIGAVWGAGSILGPVIGGAFSDSPATWRWAFYINLVIAAFCGPIYLLYLPSVQPEPGTKFLRKLATVDWIGFFLSSGAVVAFTMVLTFAGAAWPWRSAATIAVFIVFGVLMSLFIVQQRLHIFTTLQRRIFPCHLLQSRSQILLYIGTSAATTNLFIPVYYIPIYFQFVHGDTALMAAVRLLPFILVLIATTMVSGIISPKIGYYMPFYLATGVFSTIGGALMVTITRTTPIANVYGYSVLIAIGTGLSIQMGYAIATVKVGMKLGPDEVSNAVSLQNVSQVGATLIALVISGQVFQSLAFNKMKDVLFGQGFSDSQIRDAVAGTHSVVFHTISPELKEKAVEAITSAIGKVWVLCVVAGVVSLCIAPLMKRERLFGMTAVAGG